MLDESYKIVIELLNSKFSNSKIDWYLTGKISLALQGMNIQPKNIGVLIHEEDLNKALKLFSEYKISEIIELPNKEAKEFTLEINKIPVLICAEYKNGTYWKVKETNKVKIGEINVLCFSLEANKNAYEKIGMKEKAKLIEEFTIILKILNSPNISSDFQDNGYTFEEIVKSIKKEKIKLSEKKLKKLLKDMEKEGLLEERHFGKEYDYRVDYNLENKGIKIIN
jgi:DNA-binding HxlR family transcriptional regulator